MHVREKNHLAAAIVSDFFFSEKNGSHFLSAKKFAAQKKTRVAENFLEAGGSKKFYGPQYAVVCRGYFCVSLCTHIFLVFPFHVDPRAALERCCVQSLF